MAMSVDLWQSLLKKGPVMTLRWGEGRSVHEVSGGMEYFTNLQLEPGSNYIERIHPDDRERVKKLFNQYESAPLDTTYRLLDDDREYPVREYSLPCAGVTEVREGLLILQNPEAETAQISARLQRCEKELQDFAYIASHDLQEPLRKVQAFGGRLDQKFAAELGEQGKDYLARMLSATERMQGFLNGLLEYSRVVSRGKPPARCDLNIICAELVDRLRNQAGHLDARIAVGELPIIEADCDQMRQLLRHLLENALKFHMEGVRPIIAISAKVKQDVVEILVNDNGMGFTQDDAEKVFQVFQRLHGRTRYPGSGIGLAVCRRIVECHGGQIHANSTPGRGASFIMTLPITQNSERLV
jgi:light-regulated signal transduction histidine kinase (bacteriophytochrome)